jgi:hypothetical protein
VQRSCASCGVMFTPIRANHRFHSDTCRVNGARGKLQPGAEDQEPATTGTKPSPPLSETLVSATRKQLEEVGRLDTYLGQQALALASVLAVGKGTPSGLATISRELRETMTAALRGAGGATSAVVRHRDEVAARRARRSA